ncbi:glycosyltransferase [Brevibacterium oceani]|uniref:glycosyltransferase n=1 Tax=Brevibacterium oceani TaxID=358099 RepID=UPI001B340F41|nr:glycosyltransferase [Brevibacterium oceani]
MTNTFVTNSESIRSLSVENFPSGKHAVVTWAIPDNFGGMTKALLHRSESFVRHAGVSVDILTFDWRESYEPVRERLRQSGALIDGMRVLNFWETVADIPDACLAEFVGTRNTSEAYEPLFESMHYPESLQGMGSKKWTAGTEQQISVDGYFRPDGSLFLARVQELDSGGNVLRRRVRIYHRDGSVAGECRAIRELYFSWLDYWSSQNESFMIVDSKYAANLLVKYRRPHVYTIYMVHGSHLESNDQTPFSELSKSRGVAFQNLHRFDAVCVLTSRQRDHVITRFGDLGNLHVVPNGHTAPTPDKGGEREAARGTMLAILSKRKRVDHAIQALLGPGKELPEGASLHIFGVGEEEQRLRGLIGESDDSGKVVMEGFTNEPYAEFGRASFSLLTSAAEGFPLVLLEMMAAGCVPIAYDVNYGPSQIIDDKVNGYLVRRQDPVDLRVAIDSFLGLSDDERTRMREAAIKKSAEFSDRTVVGLWKVVFNGLQRRSDSGKSVEFTVENAAVTYFGDDRMRIQCKIAMSSDSLPSSAVCIAAYARDGGLYLRRNISEFRMLGGGAYVVSADLGAECFPESAPAILDFYFEVIEDDRVVRRRLPFAQKSRLPAVYGTIHGNLSLRA